MIRGHRARMKRESRAGEGAAQVVVRVAVAAGKVRTGEPENHVHLGGSPTLPQQVPRDPPIDDAPIGLGETLADVPALQAALIDPGGERRGDTRDIIRQGQVGAGDQAAGSGDVNACADCSSASACGAKPAWVSTTLTQGA